MLAAKTHSLQGATSGPRGGEVVELRPKSRATKRAEVPVTGPDHDPERRWVFYGQNNEPPAKRPCPGDASPKDLLLKTVTMTYRVVGPSPQALAIPKDFGGSLECAGQLKLSTAVHSDTGRGCGERLEWQPLDPSDQLKGWPLMRFDASQIVQFCTVLFGMQSELGLLVKQQDDFIQFSFRFAFAREKGLDAEIAQSRNNMNAVISRIDSYAKNKTSLALPLKPSPPIQTPRAAEPSRATPSDKEERRWLASMNLTQTRDVYCQLSDKPLLIIVVLPNNETPASRRNAYHADFGDFYVEQHDYTILSLLHHGDSKAARIFLPWETFRAWVGACPSSIHTMQPWYFRQMLRDLKYPNVLCGIAGDVSDYYDVSFPTCRLNREILDFTKTLTCKFFVHDQHGARLPGTWHTGLAKQPAVAATPPAVKASKWARPMHTPGTAVLVRAHEGAKPQNAVVVDDGGGYTMTIRYNGEAGPGVRVLAKRVTIAPPPPPPAPAPANAPTATGKKPATVVKTHVTNLESYLAPSMHPFLPDEIADARKRWKELRDGSQITPESALHKIVQLSALAKACKRRLGDPVKYWVANIRKELEQREWPGTDAPEFSDAYNLATMRGAQQHMLNIFAELRGESAEKSRNRVVNPVELEVFNKDRMLNRRAIKRSETLLAKWTSSQTQEQAAALSEASPMIERVRSLLHNADARRARSDVQTARKEAVQMVKSTTESTVWKDPFDCKGLVDANEALARAERCDSADSWKKAARLTQALLTSQQASSDANEKKKVKMHETAQWLQKEVECATKEVKAILDARTDVETSTAFKALQGKQQIINEFTAWCSNAGKVDAEANKHLPLAKTLCKKLDDKGKHLARFGEAMRRKLAFIKSQQRDGSEDASSGEEQEEVMCTGERTWAQRDAEARKSVVDLDDDE